MAAEDPAPAAAAPLPAASLRHAIVRFAPGVVIPAFVNLAAAAVFTRMFSTQDYGRYALALASATMIVMIITQWLQQGTLRFVSVLAHDDRGAPLRRSIADATTLLVIGAAIVGVLLALFAVPRLPDHWHALAYPAIVLSIAATGYQCGRAVLQAELRSALHSRYQAALSIAGFLLVLVGVSIIEDPGMLLWGPAIATAIVLPMLWRSAHLPAVSLQRMRRGTRSPELDQLIAYGTPMVGWFIAAGTFDLGNRLIIQVARGPAEVGVYSASYTLVAGAAGLLLLPLNLALHPHLIRCMSDGDHARAAVLIRQIWNAGIAATVAAVGVAVLLAKPLFELFVGVDFRAGFIIAPAILAGALLWQLGMITHKPLESANRTGALFAASALAAAANLGLNVLLVPRFGFVAAAYVTLACYVLYVGLTTVWGKASLDWSMDHRFTLVTIGIGIIGFGLAVYALRTPGGVAGAGIAAVLAVATIAIIFAPAALWARADALPWRWRMAA